MNTRLPGFLTATTIGVSVFLFLWFAIYLIGAMLDAHGDGLAAFFVACLFSGFAFLCGIVSALLRLQAIHQLLQELHLHREAPRFSVPLGLRPDQSWLFNSGEGGTLPLA